MLSTILLAGLAATVSADCSRSFLQNATDTYITAQTSGKSNLILALTADNLTYTENGRALNIRNSTLSQPIKIDFNRSIHDTVQCASFTEIIAATNPHPYVIHTRMVFTSQKASTIESIVTDDGDWLFNATGTLNLNAPEKWDPIPKEKQNTRAVVQSLGDAYFDRFGNVSVQLPWGAPCYRLEGGLSAKGNLTGDNCTMDMPSTIHIPYRRYVVDEEYGVVDMFIGFPGLDRTQGQTPMPDSHVFRVENGKIRYVHTASACVTKGCGLNSTLNWRAGSPRRYFLRY